MRNGQNKRMRGRSRNKGHNPLTRVYESNGPDVKIRGTASHVAEKYQQLARDSHVSGDPIAAENYAQHAEHYLRLIAAAQEQFRQSNPYFQGNRPEGGGPDMRGDDDSFDEGDDDGAPQFGDHEQQPAYGPRDPQPYLPRDAQFYPPREHNKPAAAAAGRPSPRRRQHRPPAVLHHRRRQRAAGPAFLRTAAAPAAGKWRRRLRQPGAPGRRRSLPAASPAPAPSRPAQRHVVDA